MRPEKLIISGWGPYKSKVEIDFNRFEGRGLFLVTGATGAGKTTIFDAITYALYGSLSGDVREKNSVRSDFADADTPTFVELTMKHGGKDYRILRNPEYARPKKRGGQKEFTKEKENAVLYLPDGKVLEGTKEVNAKVQEILVLDYRQFKQITMIAQGEFAKLLMASPKEKTGIFRDIFGTGIYEQFAQNLRQRAGVLYGKIAEKKSKLEEDIHLLLEGRAEDDDIKTLVTLTEKDNWNYDVIEEELGRLSAQLAKQEKALSKECVTLQERKDELTAEVTAKKKENEQVEKFLQAEENYQLLKSKEAEMDKKRECLKRARTAENLVPLSQNVRIAAQGLLEKQNALETKKAAREAQLAEQKELHFFEEKRAELQEYLETERLFEEENKKRTEAEKAFADSLTKWDKAKKSFLEAEKVRDERQAVYAQADRLYRHAITGVVVKMLKPNEPCPVCGSLTHPNPAKEVPGLPSEEELKRLKEELEQAETVLQKCQEEAAILKVQTEETEKRQNESERVCEQLAQELKTKQPLFNGFAEAFLKKENYKAKADYVQEKTERLAKLIGSLSEGEEQLIQLSEEIAVFMEKKVTEEDAFAQVLKAEHFSTEEEWKAARISKKETEELDRELQEYANNLAGAESVKSHLEATLKGRQKHDLTALSEHMEEYKQALENGQTAMKRAHAFLGEVNKTTDRFAEGRKEIAAAEDEYGYVKDLDNLASGKNAKRLVFEQYVLAGFFEKILRAANLRFYKMTGGRYKMSRVEEAADGRVKDSLEIQVMDYYTGKARSVKTLSGGECFKASLSLALGMSDVIQAANGGIRVDTLFIDEGFGALDSESLDQACEALTGLVEHDRLIGIISHVPELRERIDSQIVIEKTNSGSHAKICV